MTTKTLMNVRGIVVVLATGVLGLLAAAFLSVSTAQAACPTLPTTNGTATATVNVPVTGNYRVWVRMMTTSAPHTVYLEVDPANDVSCGNKMGGSGSTNAWKWVDYKDGNTSSKVNVNNLSAGNHVIKMTGNDAGVKVDRVLLLTDTSCTPTGTGNNCSGTPDTTAPSVSVTAPSGGATVSGGSVALTATANDTGGGSMQSVEFFVDGVSVGTDTNTSDSTFSVNWNSAGVSDGSHTITAVARDNWNNSTTSSGVTVTVSNNPVGSASVSLTPASGNFQPGASLAVQVHVDSGSSEMDAARAHITYDTNKLTYNSVSASGSGFNTAAPTETGSGFVEVNRGSNTPITGNQLLATVNFTVKTAATGSFTLILDQGQTLVLLAGDQLTVTRNNGSYTANDTTNPSAPTGVTATTQGTDRINLSWNAATDNVGVTRYIVERNGTAINSNVTGTTFSDTNLTPGTYNYRIRAADAAGNTSALSSQASATLQAKKGDFNQDGLVNIVDLSIFLTNWGTSNALTDLNNDGTTNIIDLSIFLSNWGK